MFTRIGYRLGLVSHLRHSLYKKHTRTFRRILNQEQNNNKELQEIPSEDHKYDVKEEEMGISGFELTDVVEKPLISLNITDRMKKLKKPGSLAIDMFVGKLDADFLIYPECLDNRRESALLYQQSGMVRQLWPKIWNDPEKLQQFNFNNMYELSVTEMMTIFEAIGSSGRSCYEADPENFNHIDVARGMISLITRNCLTYYPLKKTQNVNLKNALLPPVSLEFAIREHDRVLPPIGFAYTERPQHFGSIPPQEWSTLGMEDDVNNFWSIEGKKSRLLVEDNTQHYLVFFRDKSLAEKIGTKATGNEPNPNTDPLTGACIVNKDLIKTFSPIYTDSAGLKYYDIDLDLVISKDYEVFPAEKKSAWPLNIKGLGQLSTSAVALGLSKGAPHQCFRHLLDKSRGPLGCHLFTRQFHAEGSIRKYLDFRHKFRTNHLRLHLRIIRRQKMKKHKLKKFRKKFKTLIAKRKFKREIIKEKNFRTELLSKIREAEEFDPRAYAMNAIKKAELESKKVSWAEVFEEIRERCRVGRAQTWYIKPRHKRDLSDEL